MDQGPSGLLWWIHSAVAIPLHVALRVLFRSEDGLAELALDQLDENCRFY